MKSPRARIYQGTERNLTFLARRLQAGEIVAVPTETVYGLAGNALDPKACARIFRAKRRPVSDPLIVHVHSLGQLAELCASNAAAERLAGAFWPGPLTLVLPKRGAVPDIVTAGRDSVAIRMPSHPLFRRLLKRTGLPLAAPSANPFGYISPTTAEHVRQGLGARIGYILDGGASTIGLESTIVDLRRPEQPHLLRPGAITLAQLEKVLGQNVRARPTTTRAGNPAEGQIAPGQLLRHYSPRTPVLLHRVIDQNVMNDANAADAFVLLRRPGGRAAANVFWLDARGNLRAAGRRLFSVLRKLDTMKFRQLHVELAPEEDIGPAINDRLRRAAAR